MPPGTFIGSDCEVVIMDRRLREWLAPAGLAWQSTERFVGFIIGGGLSLVAGLWGLTLVPVGSPASLVGIGLVVGGCAGMAHGIRTPLDW